MADGEDKTVPNHVTVEINDTGNTNQSSQQSPWSGPTTDDIENDTKKPNVNWEDEDIVLADKDNKTSKPEYYLRSDVKLEGKIVEDAIDDSTHPYDHPNCLIRWFYKLT